MTLLDEIKAKYTHYEIAGMTAQQIADGLSVGHLSALSIGL